MNIDYSLPLLISQIDFEANIKKRYSNANTVIKISSTSASNQVKSRVPGVANQKPPLSGGQIKPIATTEVPKKRSRWDSSDGLAVLGKVVTEAPLTSRSVTGTLTTAPNTRL